MVSAFSGSESDLSFLSSSLEECSTMTVTQTSESEVVASFQPQTEMIPPRSPNTFEDGDGTPIRKLVLVDSIINDIGDSDKGLKEDISNNNCSVAENDNDGSGKSEGGISELNFNLQKLTQQLEVVLTGGLVMPELTKLVEVLVPLPDSIRTLQRQVGEMQLMMSNMNNLLVTVMPPRNAPPAPQQLAIKAEESEYTRDAEAMNSYRHNDKIFLTPKKLTEQRGLDLTPVTPQTNQDQHPQKTTISLVRNESGYGYNCNFPIPKRSLTFPKSLVRILDSRSDEQSRIDNDGLMQMDEHNSISTIRIKEEPQEAEESPSNDLKYGFGLLALADAALKERSEETNSLPGSEEWPSSSDSGRSTGDSFPVGSPPTDQASDDAHSQQIESLKACDSSKYHSQESRHTRILPKPPSSDLSSTSSEPSVMVERKTRKRRKTKEPIPCEFCGKAFNNQSSLRQHESFHRPTRPYTCNEEKCDKAYKTRSELNRHLVVHSGEKKHFCKLCGKRFLRKQYLKTHLIRHHETGITMVTPARRDENGQLAAPIVTVASSSFVSQAEPLTWRCQLCLKIFVNNEDLKKHVRSYHEKKRSEKLKL